MPLPKIVHKSNSSSTRTTTLTMTDTPTHQNPLHTVHPYSTTPPSHCHKLTPTPTPQSTHDLKCCNVLNNSSLPQNSPSVLLKAILAAWDYQNVHLLLLISILQSEKKYKQVCEALWSNCVHNAVTNKDIFLKNTHLCFTIPP